MRPPQGLAFLRNQKTKFAKNKTEVTVRMKFRKNIGYRHCQPGLWTREEHAVPRGADELARPVADPGGGIHAEARTVDLHSPIQGPRNPMNGFALAHSADSSCVRALCLDRSCPTTTCRRSTRPAAAARPGPRRRPTLPLSRVHLRRP